MAVFPDILPIIGARCAVMAGAMGHVENALSLLDQPGEWFLDQKAGLVYYMPADGENPNTRQFIVPKLEQIVCLRGRAQTPVQSVELRRTPDPACWSGRCRPSVIDQSLAVSEYGTEFYAFCEPIRHCRGEICPPRLWTFRREGSNIRNFVFPALLT